jgi:hypothetical protein
VASQLVFSGNLNPATPNLSVRFTSAIGFFIQVPNSFDVELEIDVFLQVYLPSILGEVVRSIPLGKIEEQAILLNITDTETFNVIPYELQNTNLEMALLFLASDNFFLYAEAIKPDCNLCTVSSQLDLVNQKLDLILSSLVPVVPVNNFTINDPTDALAFNYLQGLL